VPIDVEVFARLIETLKRFRAGDHVEFAARRQHQLAQIEIFKVPPEPAARTADAFGDHAHLAAITRQDRKNAIGLAEIHSREHHRFGSENSFAPLF
jgi:hypothetical protein